MIKVIGAEQFKKRCGFIANMVNTSKTPLTKSSAWLKKDVDANFKKNGNLFQSGGWPKLKPSTIKQRKEEGYGPRPILKRRGRLQRSFRQKIKSGLAKIYSISPYFKYHQIGGRKIPMRKMLGIRSEGITAVVNIYADSIVNWFRMVFK